MPASAPARTARLGEQLLEGGRITRAQLDAALKLAREQRLKIGQALVALGALTEHDLALALRRQGKILCIHLTPDIVDREVARRLAERTARRYVALPIHTIAGVTTVAMADPGDLAAVDEIALELKSRVLAVYAEAGQIEAILDSVWGRGDAAGEAGLDDIAGRMPIDGDGEEVRLGSVDEEDAIGSEEDEALERPVVQLVGRLVREACEAGASDIHLEPRRQAFVIRFRVDGALYDRLVLSRAWARPVLARLKVLARLDLAQSRLPQDGRFHAEIDGRMVDMRLATTPTQFGEGAVIRVLDSASGLRTLDSLGLSEEEREQLLGMIDGGDGIVLATGPTGSGKTTTLYALIDRLNRPDRKIITLEDPVENQVEGIVQISVQPKIGLDFARGLRSILRQDPDVVLVGEIRDTETARIAVQASLTGHLVLSTLHTVGAVETIARLADMGVESYLLADTLRGVVAQRLLRRVCERCKTCVRADARALARLGLPEEVDGVCQGSGCEACHGTGYRGRVAVREILVATPEVQRLVRRGRRSEEIRRAAVKAGMRSLRDAAIEKVLSGETTVAEAIAATARG